MDERHQSLEGGLVALSPFEEQRGDRRGMVRYVAIVRLSRFKFRPRVSATHTGGITMKPILHTLEPHRLNHGLPDQIRRLAILTTVVVSLSGCNRPTAPTVPMGEHSVSGVVSERTSSGSVPLEAVQIREEASGRYATTDSAGFYELSRLPGPSGVIIASKAGYATVRRTLAVNGDTRLDLEVRTIATQVLSGVVFETTARGRIAVEGVLVSIPAAAPKATRPLTLTRGAFTASRGWTTARCRSSSAKKATSSPRLHHRDRRRTRSR